MAGIAYERDMSRCLEVVKKNFEWWERKEITVWELNDKIHEYHNDIARELYKIYEMNDPHIAVACGIRQGVLDKKEVNEDCMSKLHGILEYFESNANVAV